MAVGRTARGPSWLLIAAALPFVFAMALRPVGAAPTENNDNTHALDTYDDSGCYYNYQHYGEGDRIITNEPCLNCTCHNRMLMCYLRVCPFTKAIGQDCTVEKRPDQCCPVITCPEVPVQLLENNPSPSTTLRPVSQHSTALGHPDSYGCTIDSEFYTDGAQVPSDRNKPCELCYCIRNHTACVMQECTLQVEGCKPVYQDGVCCPVRYECEYPDEPTTLGSIASLFFTTTTTMSPNTMCRHNGEEYADGALIQVDDKPCEHCYCMRGEIVCAVQECGTPLEREGHNCTALPTQPGKCCPEMYQCDSMPNQPEVSSDAADVPLVQQDGQNSGVALNAGEDDKNEEIKTDAPDHVSYAEPKPDMHSDSMIHEDQEDKVEITTLPPSLIEPAEHEPTKEVDAAQQETAQEHHEPAQENTEIQHEPTQSEAAPENLETQHGSAEDSEIQHEPVHDFEHDDSGDHYEPNHEHSEVEHKPDQDEVKPVDNVEDNAAVEKEPSPQEDAQAESLTESATPSSEATTNPAESSQHAHEHDNQEPQHEILHEPVQENPASHEVEDEKEQHVEVPENTTEPEVQTEKSPEDTHHVPSAEEHKEPESSEPVQDHAENHEAEQEQPEITTQFSAPQEESEQQTSEFDKKPSQEIATESNVNVQSPQEPELHHDDVEEHEVNGEDHEQVSAEHETQNEEEKQKEPEVDHTEPTLPDTTQFHSVPSKEQEEHKEETPLADNATADDHSETEHGTVESHTEKETAVDDGASENAQDNLQTDKDNENVYQNTAEDHTAPSDADSASHTDKPEIVSESIPEETEAQKETTQNESHPSGENLIHEDPVHFNDEDDNESSGEEHHESAEVNPSVPIQEPEKENENDMEIATETSVPAAVAEVGSEKEKDETDVHMDNIPVEEIVEDAPVTDSVPNEIASSTEKVVEENTGSMADPSSEVENDDEKPISQENATESGENKPVYEESHSSHQEADKETQEIATDLPVVEDKPSNENIDHSSENHMTHEHPIADEVEGDHSVIDNEPHLEDSAEPAAITESVQVETSTELPQNIVEIEPEHHVDAEPHTPSDSAHEVPSAKPEQDASDEISTDKPSETSTYEAAPQQPEISGPGEMHFSIVETMTKPPMHSDSLVHDKVPEMEIEKTTDKPEQTLDNKPDVTGVFDEVSKLPSITNLTPNHPAMQDMEEVNHHNYEEGHDDFSSPEITADSHSEEKEDEKVAEAKPSDNVQSSEEVTEAGEEISTESANGLPQESLIPGEGNCNVDNIIYKSGEKVPVSNNCQKECECKNSIVHCQLQECPPPPSNDRDCMPIVHEGKCCPSYTCDHEVSYEIVTDAPTVDAAEQNIHSEGPTDAPSTDAPLQPSYSTSQPDFKPSDLVQDEIAVDAKPSNQEEPTHDELPGMGSHPAQIPLFDQHHQSGVALDAGDSSDTVPLHDDHPAQAPQYDTADDKAPEEIVTDAPQPAVEVTESNVADEVSSDSVSDVHEQEQQHGETENHAPFTPDKHEESVDVSSDEHSVPSSTEAPNEVAEISATFAPQADHADSVGDNDEPEFQTEAPKPDVVMTEKPAETEIYTEAPHQQLPHDVVSDNVVSEPAEKPFEPENIPPQTDAPETEKEIVTVGPSSSIVDGFPTTESQSHVDLNQPELFADDHDESEKEHITFKPEDIVGTNPEDAATPVEHKPTEEEHKPSEDAHKPTEAEPKPIDEELKPSEEHKPTEEEHKPSTDEQEQPAEVIHSQTPVGIDHRPTEIEHEPTDEGNFPEEFEHESEHNPAEPPKEEVAPEHKPEEFVETVTTEQPEEVAPVKVTESAPVEHIPEQPAHSADIPTLSAEHSPDDAEAQSTEKPVEAETAKPHVEMEPAEITHEVHTPDEHKPALSAEEHDSEEPKPADQISEEHAPVEPSEENVPAEHITEEHKPADHITEEHSHVEPIPEEPKPADLISEEHTPVEPIPEEPKPADHTSEEQAHVEPIPEEPKPADHTTEEQAHVEPIPEEPKPADHISDEHAHVEPIPEEPKPADVISEEHAPVEPIPEEPKPADHVSAEEHAPVEPIPEEPKPADHVEQEPIPHIPAEEIPEHKPEEHVPAVHVTEENMHEEHAPEVHAEVPAPELQNEDHSEHKPAEAITEEHKPVEQIPEEHTAEEHTAEEEPKPVDHIPEEQKPEDNMPHEELEQAKPQEEIDEEDDMYKPPGGLPQYPGMPYEPDEMFGSFPDIPQMGFDEEHSSFGPGTCRYGGKVYLSAQQIPRDDPCDFCFCFRSDIICLQQSCPPPIKNCNEEAIEGFCCPRYECPVQPGFINSTTTTTTTTAAPELASFIYQRKEITGCLVQGNVYRVGEEITSASGPCLDCRCGGDNKMRCEPKACSPQPLLRKMIEAVSLRR